MQAQVGAVNDGTTIQQAASNSDPTLHASFERLYAELKKLARAQLAASAGHTLNTTALVHEVYLKLARPAQRELDGRAHFFALAAKAMRQIVIDHARARLTHKRGGDEAPMTLNDAADVADAGFGADDLLRLDRALQQMEREEPRLAELVEQRFFAGLSIADIAVMQSISERTLNRDWRRAKAQLHAALHPDS
jgi:RNA polymerase sigma factor (TIGR02999 family)